MGPLIHRTRRKDWLSKDDALNHRMMWDQIVSRIGTVKQAQAYMGMTSWARCQLFECKVSPQTSRIIIKTFNELYQ